MRTGVWQPQFTAALSELKFHGTVDGRRCRGDPEQL
jgi:hypothetical protein